MEGQFTSREATQPRASVNPTPGLDGAAEDSIYSRCRPRHRHPGPPQQDLYGLVLQWARGASHSRCDRHSTRTMVLKRIGTQPALGGDENVAQGEEGPLGAPRGDGLRTLSWASAMKCPQVAWVEGKLTSKPC